PVAALLLLFRLRPAAPPPDEGARGDGVAVGSLLAVAVVALAFAPFYYRNLAPAPGGGLTFYALPDLVLHLSIAQELTHCVPPTAPFLPGASLSYHYGADLVLALFAAVPGLGIEDLAARFLPTLFFALALGASFAAARAFGLGRAGATACAFLVLFGEDFSFLPALLRGAPPGEPWAVTMLQAPTVVSLFMMNPMLPALGLLFASLASLARYCQGRGRGHLVGAVVLAAGLVDVKVFAAAQLLAALGLAALGMLWRTRDRRLLWASLALAALVLPRLLLSAAGEGGQTQVTFGLSSFVPDAVVNLGLRETALGAAVFDLVDRGSLGPGPLLAVLAASALYLVLVFGLRTLGLPAGLRALSLRDPREAHRLVLAAFVLLGPVLALGLQVLPASATRGPEAYNNAVWFLVQAKYAAWVFAAERLGGWWRSGSPLRRAGLVAGVLALALPSTLQFMRLQFAAGPPALDRHLVEVAAYLRAHEAPGLVVVAPEAVGGPLISLAPVRSPLEDALFPHFRGRVPGVKERLDAFWDAWDYGTPIEGPLRALGRVDLVVARPRRTVPEGAREVFRNDALAVYRVTGSGGPDGPRASTAS
ncbi:MAG TPA: hypothetical protein VGB87_02790, partial [Vicinamibacteria bacterium]